MMKYFKAKETRIKTKNVRPIVSWSNIFLIQEEIRSKNLLSIFDIFQNNRVMSSL